MDAKEYQGLALNTCKRVNFDFDLRHAVWGLITETGEIAEVYKRLVVYGKPIDNVNLCEEVGDVLWYFALGYDVLELDFEQLIGEADHVYSSRFGGASSAIGLARTVGGIVALVDRDTPLTRFDTGLEQGFRGAARQAMWRLAEIGHSAGFTVAQSMAANIAKLSKRYPNGFSETKALNRDLAAERTALEAGGA